MILYKPQKKENAMRHSNAYGNTDMCLKGTIFIIMIVINGTKQLQY